MQPIDDLPAGSRVLVRVDLNSPVEDTIVIDNRRFSRHAKTVRHLSAAGHRIVLMAHQGRPGGDEFVSLAQHAEILSEHVNQHVEFVDQVHGQRAIDAIRRVDPGQAILLENVRMCDHELPEQDPERHANTELVQDLAPEFDAYVNDAYSTSHRKHASLVGFPVVLPAYAGRVMIAEHEANSSIGTREFDGPVTMVIGGSKATDVIRVMEALDDRVDRFLVGGVAGELFLRAVGHNLGYDVQGTDLYDHQWEKNCDTIQRLLAGPSQIQLPADLACESDGRDERAVTAIEKKEDSFLDIGSKTVKKYAPSIRASAAVFMKGSMGVFEDDQFARGTIGMLEEIAAADCFSVIGGGDTSRAIELYGLDEAQFSHVSIAGGAYIRSLTGQTLPSIDLLE